MASKDKTEVQPRQVIYALDPVAMNEELQKANEQGTKKKESEDVSTLGLILKSLRHYEAERQQRMAFEIDPQGAAYASYGQVYRQKIGLTPDHILKRITGPQGDDLVNQILQSKSNLISSFGRPRTSRFAIGFEFQNINNQNKIEDEAEFQKEKEAMDKLKEVLWNCGYKGLDEDWHPNLSQFLKMITRDGLTFGRFAVEFIYANKNGEEICHSFRAVDAGTIYRIMPAQSRDTTRRKQALELLQTVKNKKFDVEKYDKDDYKWVQVINGQIVQVFTEKELMVYNLYPTTNVEYNGYPLTPIDQALNAIATHVNITLHNKLYFEHGRASRGMLIFKSDDIDEGTIQKIRLQFHQSINSVQNSWRMPVFGVGSQDEVTWQSIDVSGRDAEFQYLSDQTARVILGAFQTSPDELPGYAHLSRGTNTQALSESDNEYKLTAARDVGLRPLIYDIQDFINTHILPKFDKSISRSHQLVLAGLEHDSPEKEATRLGQDMAIHMTYDEVLEKVEKKKIGPELGGNLPLNQLWNEMVAPYLTVGQIMEGFFKVKDASSDPRFNYVRDPFWVQFQQLLLQKAQMQMQQAMMMQQSMMQAQQPQGEGGEEGGGQEQGQSGGVGQGQPPPQEQQAPQGASDEEKEQVQKSNLERRESWLANNYMMLSKSIDDNHSTISKMILKRHSEIVDRQMEEWRKESGQAVEEMTKLLRGK